MADVTCPSLQVFSEQLGNYFANFLAAVPSGGRFHDMDAHADIGGYPMVCAMLNHPSNPAAVIRWSFLFTMGVSGTPLDTASLQDECHANAMVQVSHEEAPTAVGYMSTVYAPKLAESFAMVFATDVEVTIEVVSYVGDSVLHRWEFKEEATGVRFFTVVILDFGTEPTEAPNPHWAGHVVSFGVGDYSAFHQRRLAASDQNAPDGHGGGSGGGGGGGDTTIDLTPLVDKLDEVKDAIDNISIGASVNHGQFEVDIRGADGGDGGG